MYLQRLKRIGILLLIILAIVYIPYFLGKLFFTSSSNNTSVWAAGLCLLILTSIGIILIISFIIEFVEPLYQWIKNG